MRTGAAVAAATPFGLLPRALRAATPNRASAPVVLPCVEQLAWQRAERALFLHFGVNTFTGREWGDGKEDPAIFNPSRLDARQWARTAKAAGFRAIVLTAKHHDGFCLWPSETTTHSVASSPWRAGNGDVVREFVDACAAERLGAGLYLSPWDRHEPSYGDTPRYNDFYERQLTELLTRYGPLTEVWFDGANGEGPNGRKQQYDWPRVHGTVRRLQPKALMFSDAGPDIRWIGNERGTAGDPNWCAVDPSRVPYAGADGPDIISALQHGDATGTVWRPGEADVSIRPGWFWRDTENDQVRTPANLEELFFSSVGRNANLLLNVPPTRDGLLHESDARALTDFGRRLDALFANNLAQHAKATASSTLARANGAARVVEPDPDTFWAAAEDARSASIELVLSKAESIGVVSLEEAIGTRGQVVEAHEIAVSSGGEWITIASGTTIGHRRLHNVGPLDATRVRVRLRSSLGAPSLSRLGLFARSV